MPATSKNTKRVTPTNYLKNVTRSVLYSAADVGVGMMPNTSKFLSENKSFLTSTYAAIKNPKQYIKRQVGAFQNSKVYQALDYGVRNISEDLRTGNFYNKERENRDMLKFSGFDMGDSDDFSDFGIDDDWESKIDAAIASGKKANKGPNKVNDITAGDERVAKTIEVTQAAASSATVNAVLASSDAQIKNSRANIGVLYNQNERLFGGIHSDIGVLGSTMDAMMKMQQAHLGNIDKNLSSFFNDSINIQKENNAILKEMLEMQRNMYTSAEEKEAKARKSGGSRARWRDININGMPNLNAYFKNVQANIKEDLSMFDFGGGDGNMLAMMMVHPLKTVTEAMVKGVIPQAVKAAAKEFDETISGVFGNVVAELSNMSNGFGIMASIAKYFGVDTNINKGINTGKYEKGPVPFDGITRKAIVDVIPAQLGRIEAAITGQPQLVFDYSTGRWSKLRSAETIYKNVGRRMKDEVFGGYDGVRKEMTTRLNQFGYRGNKRKGLAAAYEEWENYMIDVNGRFNPKKSAAQNGVNRSKYPNLYKYFNEVAAAYDTMGQGQVKYRNTEMTAYSVSRKTKLPGKILSARDNANQSYRDLEREGIVAQWAAHSNIGFDIHGKWDSKTGKFKGNNLLSVARDHNNNNIFNYLENINRELTWQRMYGFQDLIENIMNPGAGTRDSDYITDASGKKQRPARKRGAKKPGTGARDAFNSISLENKYYGKNRTNMINAAGMARRNEDDEFYAREAALSAIEAGDYEFIADNKQLCDYVAHLNKVMHDRDSNKIVEEIGDHDHNIINNFFNRYFYDSTVTTPDGVKKSMINAARERGKVSNSAFARGMRRTGSLVGGVAEVGLQWLYTADKAVYDMLFKAKLKDDDKPSVQYNGFMDMVKSKFNGWFSTMGEGFKTHFIDPIKKAFGIDENFGQRFKEEFSNIFHGIWDRFKKANKTVYGPAAKKAQEFAQDPYKGVRDSKEKARQEAVDDEKSLENYESLRDPDFVLLLSKYGLNVVSYIGDNDFEKAKKDLDKAIVRYAESRARSGGEKLDLDVKRAKSSADVDSAIDAIDNVDDLREFARIHGIKLGNRKDPDKIKARIKAAYRKQGRRNAGGTFGAPYRGVTSLHKNEIVADDSGLHKVLETGIYNLRSFSHIINTEDAYDMGLVSGPKIPIKTALNDENNKWKNMHAEGTVNLKDSDIFAEAKKNIPEMAASGLIGGILSMVLGLAGGPLVGAAVGAGANLIRRSDLLKDKLFGKEDKNGDRTGGIIKKTTIDTVKKYAPKTLTGAMAGLIPGLMLGPIGPIGGILLGGAIGTLTETESFKKKFFGGKNGNVGELLGIGPKEKEIIGKILPAGLKGAGVGAVVSMLVGGPFGLLGNAVLGSGLGMLSSSEEFKDAILGVKDDEGNRVGGLIGAVSDAFEPLKDAMTGLKDKLINSIDELIVSPLRRFMTPTIHLIPTLSKNFAKFLGRKSKQWGTRMKATVGTRITNAMKRISNSNSVGAKLVKGATWLPRKALRAPGAIAGWIGDRERKYELRSGDLAGFDNPDEAMAWAQAMGMEDEVAASIRAAATIGKGGTNLTSDEAGQLATTLLAMNKTQAGAKREVSRSIDKTNKIISNFKSSTTGRRIDPKTVNRILKNIDKGDYESMYKALTKSGLSEADARELLDQKGLKESIMDYTKKKTSYDKTFDIAQNTELQELATRMGVKLGTGKGELDLTTAAGRTEFAKLLQGVKGDLKANPGKEVARDENTKVLEGIGNTSEKILAVLSTYIDWVSGNSVNTQEAMKAAEEGMAAGEAKSAETYKKRVERATKKFPDPENLSGAGKDELTRKGSTKAASKASSAREFSREANAVRGTDGADRINDSAIVPYKELFSPDGLTAIGELDKKAFERFRSALKSSGLKRGAASKVIRNCEIRLDADAVSALANATHSKIQSFPKVCKYINETSSWEYFKGKSLGDLYSMSEADVVAMVTSSQNEDKNANKIKHGWGTGLFNGLLGGASSLIGGAGNLLGGALNFGGNIVKGAVGLVGKGINAVGKLGSALTGGGKTRGAKYLPGAMAAERANTAAATNAVSGGGQFDETDKPDDGRDVVQLAPGEFGLVKRDSSGVELDTTDANTREAKNKLDQQEKEQKEANEAAVKQSKLMDKLFGEDQSETKSGGSKLANLLFGGMAIAAILKSGILTKVYEGVIKPIWTDHVYPWITNTAVPWITDTAIPAITNTVSDLWNNHIQPWITGTALPWLTDTAIPALLNGISTLLKSVVEGLGGVWNLVGGGFDKLFGNDKNAGGKITVDPNAENSQLTTVTNEDGTTDYYNSEHVKGVVNEDGTVTFFDQSIAGSGAATNIAGNMRRQFMAGGSGSNIVNKIVSGGTKVLGGIGDLMDRGGKVLSKMPGISGKILGAVSRVGGKAFKAVTKPLNWAHEAGKKFWGYSSGASKAAKAADTVTDAAKAAKTAGAVSDAASTVTALVPTNGPAINAPWNVAERVEDAANAVNTAGDIGATAAKAAGVADDVADAAGAGAKALDAVDDATQKSGIIANLLNKIKGFFGKLFGDNKVASKIADAAKSLGKRASSLMDDICNGVFKLFGDNADKIISKFGCSTAKQVVGKILFWLQIPIDFIAGMDKAESLLGVTDPDIFETIVAGIVYSLGNFIVVPSLVPDDWPISNSGIAKFLVGLFRDDLEERQAATKAEYEAWKEEHGSTLTESEYLEREYSKIGAAKGWISDRVQDAKNWVGEKWEDTKSWVADKYDKFTDTAVGGAIDSAAHWVGDRASDAWNWTKNTASSAWEGAKNIGSNIWNGITGFFGFGNNGPKPLAKYGRAAVSAVSGSNSGGNSLFNNIAATLSNSPIGAVVNAVQNSSFGQAVSNTYNKAKDAITNSSIGQAISSVVGKAKDWFSSISSKVSGNVTSGAKESSDIFSDDFWAEEDTSKMTMAEKAQYAARRMAKMMTVPNLMISNAIDVFSNSIINLKNNVINAMSGLTSSLSGSTSSGGTIANNANLARGYNASQSWLSNQIANSINSLSDTTKFDWQFTGGTTTDGSTTTSAMGSWGRGYVKQIDPRVSSMRYNARGDSGIQTIGDSGCGPAAAVNAVTAMYGRGGNPLVDAVKYAVNGGYKEVDGGTIPSYFGDYFAANGLSSQTTTDRNTLINNIRSGYPTVLMGQDSMGATSNTPYGSIPHYVTATGVDRSGHVIIQDPESRYDNQLYSMNDVMNKTSFGVSAMGSGPRRGRRTWNKYGKGKYGRAVVAATNSLGGGTVASSKKLIIIGDSRTVGMCNAVNGTSFNGATLRNYTAPDGNVWICAGAWAIHNMKSGWPGFGGSMIPYIDQACGPNTAVCIWMGTNDAYSLDNCKKYIEWIPEWAKVWKQKGAVVYFVATGPLGNGAKKYTSSKYEWNNEKFAQFNTTIAQGLAPSGIGYIDVFTPLLNEGCEAISDNLHYVGSTYKKVYNLIVQGVANGGATTIGGYTTGGQQVEQSTPSISTMLASVLSNSRMGQAMNAIVGGTTTTQVQGQTGMSADMSAMIGTTATTTDTSSTSSSVVDTTTPDSVAEQRKKSRERAQAKVGALLAQRFNNVPTAFGTRFGKGQYDAQIWYMLKQAGLSDAGAAGIMGNMQAESGMNPRNMENKYETKYGYTDDSYTTAVDNGSYNNFIHDSAGYGLIQFTYYTLKEALLNYAKSHGLSVGDINAQVPVLLDQMNSDLKSYLSTTTDPREAAHQYMVKFERPADQSYNASAKRGSYAQEFYNKYQGTAGVAPTSSMLGGMTTGGTVETQTPSIATMLGGVLSNSRMGQVMNALVGGSDAATSAGTATMQTGVPGSAMAMVQTALTEAALADQEKEQGVFNNTIEHAHDNNVKYNTWYYGHKVSGDAYPWCAAFVTWCAEQSGNLANGALTKTAACGTEQRHILNHGGRWVTKDEVLPGDITYDNGPTGPHEHTGIVVGRDEDGTIWRVDGNYGDRVIKYNAANNGREHVYVRPAYTETSNMASLAGTSTPVSGGTTANTTNLSIMGGNGIKPLAKYGMFKNSLSGGYGRGTYSKMPTFKTIRRHVNNPALGGATIEVSPVDQAMNYMEKHNMMPKYGTGTMPRYGRAATGITIDYSAAIDAIIRILMAIADNTDKLNIIVSILNAKLGIDIKSSDVANATTAKSIKSTLQLALQSASMMNASGMTSSVDDSSNVSINMIINAMNAIASE